MGDWKLIGHAVDTAAPAAGREPIPLFLANLSKDVGEQTNLLAKYPDMVKHLQSLHDHWLASIKSISSDP